MMKLVPRHRAPTIHFQSAEAVPMIAEKGDHVLAWPEEGRMIVLTETELRVAYDVVTTAAGAKWTEHRRARGNGALIYSADMHPVSSGEVLTLVALQRAASCGHDVWTSTAMVTSVRSDLADSSADRVAADLSDLKEAGLVERRQDPLQRARKYVWRTTVTGDAVVASHGDCAVAEVGFARSNGAGTDVSIPGTEQPECP